MRRIWDFHGGVHPNEKKTQSLQRPIVTAALPPVLVLPLSQHIGAPAQPLVEVGDHVLKGQILAEANGFVSVPLHAPTSGTVSAIEARQIAHPSGLTAPCVVLEPDGEDQWVAHSGHSDWEQLDRSALLEIIRGAGIAGMGGAGFPTAVKLAGKPGVAVETLIINGTECEPYITADDSLMRERAVEIVAGTLILHHLVEPGETLIGIENNKPEALAAMRAACAGTELEVVEFPTKYPSGGEKQLIEILTGKQVPSGGLPADVGILCQNVGSASAIFRAVTRGEPLISRITTVTGEAVENPGNFETLLGTPLSWLLQEAGYQPAQSQRLVMGGPMMGFTVADTNVPIVKTTNCVLAPTSEELPAPPPAQACIRCGMCAEACPASLLPQQMFWFAQGKEYDKLEQHNLADCIECGACSYVCPSSIPLVQYYRAAKAEMNQLRQDQQKSDHSRERFEARQARLEREAADKEAKRAARKKAAEERARQAASGESAQDADPIQAAIERAQARKAAQQTDTGAAATPADEIAKLQATVDSTRARLEKAETRLADARAAGDANAAALETAVDKTRQKLATAEAAVAKHHATAPLEVAEVSSGDAAQDAIARAQAARQAAESMNPEDKARENLDKLRTRLLKTEQRLADSCEAGEQDKVLEALTSTVARLRGKIAGAEKSLGLPASAPAEPSNPTNDPAQAAIERALARRSGSQRQQLTPIELLRKNHVSVTAKLSTTREKLQAARNEGDDTVTALAGAEQKLTEKLQRIERELAELEQEA